MNNPRKILNDALHLHQSGRVREAIDLYRKALRTERNNASLFYLLGTACCQIGQIKTGAEHLQHSLALDSRNAQAHFNLATALRDLGQVDGALESFGRAIARKPDFAEAYHGRGIALQIVGRPDEALASYAKAIALKPNHVDAHVNRGVVLRSLARPDEALASCDRAIALKPDYAEAYVNRGNILQDLERPAEAVASYDRAIALKPGLADAHYRRAEVLRSVDRAEEALAGYDRAIALKPDFVDAHINRGIALRTLKRFDEALASYDHAIALDPGDARAHYNHGNALLDQYRPDEAVASYDRAIALNPGHVEAHINRGNALESLRRTDEALANYDRALALRPDDPEAYHNRAICLLRMGRYVEGWKAYDWRKKKEYYKYTKYAHLSEPAWTGGEDVKGKTVFVYSEQGFGDVIQFCRYIPLIHALGAEVVVDVQKPLSALVSTLNCPFRLVQEGERLPHFDVHCPVMSLPYLFGTTVETIPATVPYLSSDKGKVEDWKKAFKSSPKMKIGIAWSGNSSFKNDAIRSLSLPVIEKIFDVDAEFHCLQKGYNPLDLDVLHRFPIIDHEKQLDDFTDTAALIDATDLVITSDTSTAHLAGALGKPVWIMLSFVPDFRWMLDRPDSPWYPTARLFRQTSRGDWTSVIDAVVEALRGHVSAAKAPGAPESVG